MKIISPEYAYLGYTCRDIPFEMMILPLLLAIFPAVWISPEIKRPSQAIYWILFLFVYIPSSIIPYYVLEADLSDLLILNLALFVSIGILSLFCKFPLLIVPKIRISSPAYWSLLAIISLLIYFKVFTVFGFHLNVKDMTDIYKVRFAYKNELLEKGVFLSYIINWQANAFNPIFIASGIMRRDIAMILFGIVGEFFLFQITGFKSAIFVIFLVLALYFASKYEARYFGFCILGGLVSSLIIGIAQFFFWNSSFFLSLIARRAIATPGLLTAFYYDYFTNNPKALLGYGLLKRFVDYPYELNPPNLIGKIYFGSPTTSANANIFADAIANFGLSGIFLVAILTGLFFWLFDSMITKRNKRLGIMLIGSFGVALSNSALFTSLMTHGGCLVMIMMYLYPGDYKKRDLSIIHRK